MRKSLKLSDFPAKDVQAARERAADKYAHLARAIRKEDSYASHVTEKQKDENLTRSLEWAEKIRSGEVDSNFSVWQNVYFELTGECIAFLPK